MVHGMARAWLTVAVAVSCLAGCTADGGIVVAGEQFATNAPVVTYLDPDGYDGQREGCWFRADRLLPTRPASGCDTPRRYSERRTGGLAPDVAAAVADQGWTLELLRQRIDQVVVHFDVCGCSKRCFEVLHDVRGLSCHFLIDVDGTVYQTLDLAARARHATIANDRSVGIEIAQIGAYPDTRILENWYAPAANGQMRITFPEALGDPGLRIPGFVGHTARPGLFRGPQNGRDLVQYDFTPEQYRSLEQVLASLRAVFPAIEARVPRDAGGQVPTGVLSREAFRAFRGVLGHHHVQANKNDPGPAFDWERIATAVRGAAQSPYRP